MPTLNDPADLAVLIEEAPGEDLQPFLDDANLLITDILGTSLSPERLKLIEKYLAAHLWVIAAEKGGLTKERALDAENAYQVVDGTGLSSTRFGQQVISFDTTGELDKALSYKKKAQLRLV